MYLIQYWSVRRKTHATVYGPPPPCQSPPVPIPGGALTSHGNAEIRWYNVKFGKFGLHGQTTGRPAGTPRTTVARKSVARKSLTVRTNVLWPGNGQCVFVRAPPSPGCNRRTEDAQRPSRACRPSFVARIHHDDCQPWLQTMGEGLVVRGKTRPFRTWVRP